MSLRTERVASLIKKEVGELCAKEFRDSQLGFITITDVHVSADLRTAKIYVSILGNHDVKERTMAMLEEKKAFIRVFLGSHVRLKFTPSLQFYLDETLDRVDRIEQLIKQIHRNDDVQNE